MSLRTIVKVSGINNLAEARYCAGMGVQYIGYSCDPDNKDRLSVSEISEIQSWLTGIEPVLELGKSGVFPSEIPSDGAMVEVAPERIKEFSSDKVIVRMSDWNFTPSSFEGVAALISPSVSEKTVSQHLPQLEEMAGLPLFISWNGTPEGLKNFLSGFSPYGVELNGKGNKAAGIFSSQYLADTIELLEEVE